MNYLDHLRYDSFETPVRFRLEGVTDESMIPGYDIERLLLEDWGVPEDSVDVARTIKENRGEIAFDAATVSDDAEQIIKSIRELISEYNEFPDELPEDKREEWEARHVKLTDVQIPEDS